MALRFFNTMSRALEAFEPIEPGHVRLYTCGPTVYNFAHIGNFRAYVFEDLLRRYLKFSGFRVTQAMNLTDVDDKTISASRAEGLPLRQFTARYAEAFFRDLETLNVERAEHYPAATDHIPEMIELIRRLLEKGIAYRSEDGSVYYSIAKFPAYGALSHLDTSGMRAGARVAHDEYDKESLADFALWKAWDEKDGDVAWDAPWGRGRPGWHVECSAMSMKHLGESFDIHTGGIDNMFPHHEDEIAQSEAATGATFVRYWLHCAHLVVDGKKMSKSLGNFYTLRDLTEKGYSGREIRYELIATHYRQSLNFTFESLQGARTALGRLDEFRARLAERATEGRDGLRPSSGPPPGFGQTRRRDEGGGPSLPAWAAGGIAAFREALDDDLNISGGLAAVFDMLRAGNKALDEGALGPADAAAALRAWDDLDRVLGFLQPPAEKVPDEVLALAAERQAAREKKDWPEADRLRKRLAELGWTVKDTAEGPRVKRSNQ